MLNENIKAIRKSKELSQEEFAAKLNVVRQTVSKWERGLSVPDSEMLIRISETLGAPVSVLLGKTVSREELEAMRKGSGDPDDDRYGDRYGDRNGDPDFNRSGDPHGDPEGGYGAGAEVTPEELRSISQRLEAINLQFAQRKERNRKILFWIFIALSVLIAAGIVAVVLAKSPYLNWDYSDPEKAVVGTFMHAFEFVFVRIAPFALAGTIVGAILTRKRRRK